MKRQLPWMLAGVLLCIMVAATTAPAQARDITDAVVRVHCGNAAGCGTLIFAGQNSGYVLTAAHVVENGQAPQAIWHDGETSAAKVVASDAKLDIALLSVTPPADAVTTPLAPSDHWPTRGDTVELIGYGGGRLRHWTASVNGYAMTEGVGRCQTLSLNTQTIGGDSGGAIVWQGKVVGVIWGGPLAGPRGAMLATHGTCCVAINAFLEQQGIDVTGPNLKQIIFQAPPNCRGGNCPLPPRLPAPISPNNDQQKLLDAIGRIEQRLDELERHPNLRIDINDVSRRLIDAMAADERFRGPPGNDGAPGRDGADASAQPVDLDGLADRVKERLAGSIRVRVEPVRR